MRLLHTINKWSVSVTLGEIWHVVREAIRNSAALETKRSPKAYRKTIEDDQHIASSIRIVSFII